MCYIPPHDSAVYRNVNSSLYEFDFFEHLNTCIRKYSDLGDVYLSGDLNSRTGDQPDYIHDISLDRYIDLPDASRCTFDLHVRRNADAICNQFGH